MAPSYQPLSRGESGASSKSLKSKRGEEQSTHMATTTLRVGGMTCGSCTSSVESGFEGVVGAANVSVSLIMERAVVQHDPNTLSPERIAEIIEDRGFEAEVLSTDIAMAEEEDFAELLDNDEDEDEENDAPQLSQTTVKVGGMTCGACTSAVEGAFKDVPGVKSFSISLLSERAVIAHESKLLSAEKIAEIIEDTGFDARVLESKPAEASTKRRKGRRIASEQKTLTTTVAIEGMTCGACTSAVEGGFKDVAGVLQFNISLLAERAVIVHDPTKLSPQQIVQTIEDRGFDAKVVSSVDSASVASSSSMTVRLNLYGMKDREDASSLESTLRSLSGITTATVDFRSSRATITHSPAKLGLRAIVEAIEGTGFNALVSDSDDKDAQLESLAKTKEVMEWRSAFWKSLSFTIPIFLTAMIFPAFIPCLDYGSIKLFDGLYLGDIVCLILTIPVQFGIGRRFYISAFKSVRHGSPTMDVLVVLGTSAAFFFSCAAVLVSIISPPHTRPSTVFETSSMLITFITLGRYMENSAKGQTSKALSRLMNLAPSMATIYADPIAAAKAAERWESEEKQEGASRNSISGSTVEKVIATELIEVGDIVILKPGDKIPADGNVVRGESYVDESMVTGEPVPILKKVGAPLMAGTVNGAGRVDFVVTRAGRDTQLSQIVRLVQEAQTSRAPIQHMADVVAGYFVQVIITLGLATFVAWMILSHVLPNPPPIFLEVTSGGKTMVCVKLCIAVIVFACPCALGLSTPTAVMVGTGVGAEQGILIKGGAVLETATKITHVVLDKTGTLTVGKMCVSRTDIHGDYATNDAQKRLWWTIIGLAEMGSEHPIARAVVSAAKDHLGLGPDGVLDGSVGDFDAVVGKGIATTVEAAATAGQRHKVIIGNAKFLRSQGIDIPSSAEESSDLDFSMPNTPATPSFKNANGTISANAGTTTIHTAIASQYTGSLHLSDTLQASAPATIAALRRMGISCSIVTGDARAPALVVAGLVGIPPEDVHAGATPSDKKSIVEDLQRPVAEGGRGEKVGMVGDGINDSPALATAAVGIALASGTDVAMEAASIVLMNTGDLLSVPASLHLSRSIFRRIKANLVFACGYNVIGLPFAMGFFLPWGYSLHPMAAGAAMACSSVSVVGSSLALKWWKRPKWMREECLDESAAEMAKTYGGSVPAAEKGLLSRGWEVVSERFSGRKRKNVDKERGAYVPLREFGNA